MPLLKAKWLFFSLLIIFITLTSGFLVRIPIVIISCEGNVLYIKPLNKELKIVVKYIHSVERTPIIEVYKVRENGLYLEEFLWKSFGAGLPLGPINSRAHIIEVNGFYCMANIEEYLGHKLEAWFIPENMCSIQIDNECIVKLSNGGLLIFRLTYIPLLEAIFNGYLGR